MLAAACSNAGALGLVGSGSMAPDLFRAHVRRMRDLTDKPWGVNVPVFYRHAADCVQIALDEGVAIVFTSAGNPRTYTPALKAAGARDILVVPIEKVIR